MIKKIVSHSVIRNSFYLIEIQLLSIFTIIFLCIALFLLFCYPKIPLQQFN